MPHILVVDDSPTQAQQIMFLLEDAGFEAASAGDGQEALAAIEQRAPDLVVTDLQMPGMNGLELVETVRSRYPLVPVILMTAFGSEEIALEALQRGAASYVPKKKADVDMVDTVSRVLAMAKATREQSRLFDYMTHVEYRFTLDNDADLIPPLISHLSESISRRKLWDANTLLRLTVAWSEALLNAIHHGNLEVSSDLRQEDEKHYRDMIERRRREAPYRDRRVYVTASISPEEAVYVIRDEGPGFNPGDLPDPTDPANMDRIGGRGLLLIRTFMDKVSHNAQGNEITLVKRRAQPR